MVIFYHIKIYDCLLALFYQKKPCLYELKYLLIILLNFLRVQNPFHHGYFSQIKIVKISRKCPKLILNSFWVIMDRNLQNLRNYLNFKNFQFLTLRGLKNLKFYNFSKIFLKSMENKQKVPKTDFKLILGHLGPKLAKLTKLLEISKIFNF